MIPEATVFRRKLGNALNRIFPAQVHNEAMKVLVVGGGGREHALIWKMKQEAEVYATPGNAGIAQECEIFDVSAKNISGMMALCSRLKPDLVVVGPEDPLIAGLADHLIGEGFPVFGPCQNAAALEDSKAWSKQLMVEAGIPTAEHQTFHGPDSASDALEYATIRFAYGRQVAVKASGAALGKGVVVCNTLDEAEDAIGSMLVEQELGEAGNTIVIEDRLVGREFSLLTVVSEGQFYSLPVAQDYKRALDNDRGPNTGGMGTICPADWVTDEMIAKSEAMVVAPMVKLLQDKGISYRGVLFSGLMVQDEIPYCLEYNVRFGDPETQSVMRRIDSGLTELLHAAAINQPLPELVVNNKKVCTVILASGGYPGKVKKGVPITVGTMPDGVMAFHAGTAMENDLLVTNGGRVLGISAIADSLDNARELAYQGVQAVNFEGMHYRSDIGS
jgi:phosphoribosylamine--glycine ligase